MRIHIVTLFPEMVQHALSYGVLSRAIENGQLYSRCFNPRDYTEDRHRTVDDKPYGGGPGMLMKLEPLQKAIRAAKSAMSDEPHKVVYLSPQGTRLTQKKIMHAVESGDNLILIAGRYEGIDERVITTLVDEEWSIGDYVLSGGEFAALVVIDAMTRLLPGVLGDEASADEDSFMHGLLDHPHYTRPEVMDGEVVPEVLLSGDHEAIRRWRLQQALGRTWNRRPEMIEQLKMNDGEWTDEMAQLLEAFQQEQENR
jgi:tRNA (guanine37-N1)-methyltransferase